MAKASKALAACRVEDLVQVRLDGAFLFSQIREFVREREKEPGSPWFLAAGEESLSDSQIRRYVQQADQLIGESFEHSRKRLRRRHLAQRRNLYARAVISGDIRTAAVVLRDEADLLGLYDRRPSKASEQPVETDRKKRLETALAFWDSVVHSGAPLAERMRAQERIDRLLGLDCIDIEERLAALERQMSGANGRMRT
jgi:hypothetical protein